MLINVCAELFRLEIILNDRMIIVVHQIQNIYIIHTKKFIYHIENFLIYNEK